MQTRSTKGTILVKQYLAKLQFVDDTFWLTYSARIKGLHNPTSSERHLKIYTWYQVYFILYIIYLAEIVGMPFLF